MSRSPEQKFWDRLNKHTKHLVDWTRVETSYAGAGIPDLDGILLPPFEPIEFKLELKVCSLKSVKFTSLWRPSQIAWQAKRSKLGGRVWNLIHHPSTSSMYLVNGRLLPQIVSNGIAVFDLCTMDDAQGFSTAIQYIRGS